MGTWKIELFRFVGIQSELPCNEVFLLGRYSVTESAGYSVRPPGLRWNDSALYVYGEVGVRRAWHVRKVKGI